MEGIYEGRNCELDEAIENIHYLEAETPCFARWKKWGRLCGAKLFAINAKLEYAEDVLHMTLKKPCPSTNPGRRVRDEGNV